MRGEILLAGFVFINWCLGSSAQAQIAGAPISIVVGAPPGGSADSAVRVVAKQLEADLGTPVVVDNRPGADMMVATRYVTRRPPNGNTLLYLPAGPATINPVVYPKDAVDTTKELTPLGMMAVVPLVLLVAADLPVRSMKEFVDYAKAYPMKLNYGSAATTHRLATEMLMLETGIKMTLVPYNGAAPIIRDLLAKEIQVAVLDLGTALQGIRLDGARPLTVASTTRARQLPDVPTASETGYPGFEMETWGSFFGPPGMSDATVQNLNSALRRTLATPTVKKLFADLAYEPVPSSPAELISRIIRDREKFQRVLERANLKF